MLGQGSSKHTHTHTDSWKGSRVTTHLFFFLCSVVLYMPSFSQIKPTYKRKNRSDPSPPHQKPAVDWEHETDTNPNWLLDCKIIYLVNYSGYRCGQNIISRSRQNVVGGPADWQRVHLKGFPSGSYPATLNKSIKAVVIPIKVLTRTKMAACKRKLWGYGLENDISLPSYPQNQKLEHSWFPPGNLILMM